MSKPTVSVIMSVHNNRSELPTTLDSLTRQTLDDYELVAVDDGSTDGSSELLDEFAAHDPRVRVLHQANTGLGPALHRACAEARGKYLARQDADDVSAPTRLERQVRYLDENPECVLCGTWGWFVDTERKAFSSFEVPDNHSQLLVYLEEGDNPFIHGSVMLRGDDYRAAGMGYRLRRYCEDYDLWLQLSTRGRLGIVESTEYMYRLSPGGMSFGNMTSRIQLRDLCLQLHAERKAHDREITDWRLAEAEILLSIPSEHHPRQRQAAVEYGRGLLQLESRDWRGYLASMRASSATRGPFLSRAIAHLLLGWAWPVTRELYRRRVAQTSRRYLYETAPGTNLPSYAKGMT